MLFERHVPGEQFPDVNFSNGILLVLFDGLRWELELVSKSLVECGDDESVLSQHKDLGRVEVFHAFASFF